MQDLQLRPDKEIRAKQKHDVDIGLGKARTSDIGFKQEHTNKVFELSEKQFVSKKAHDLFMEEFKALQFEQDETKAKTAQAGLLAKIDEIHPFLGNSELKAANRALRKEVEGMFKAPVKQAPSPGGTGKQVKTPETSLPTGWKFTGKVINGEREIIGPDGKLGVWGRVEK
jgi:hypothetical protein